MLALLDNLSSHISKKFRYINHGGCCVFASMVANHLQHHVPTRLAVFSNYSEDSTIDEARHCVQRNTLAEWNNNDVHFGHVVVEFDYAGRTYHYDSDGVCDSDGSICKGADQLPGFLTLAEANELADDEYGWNVTFNRDQIPAMKKCIDNILVAL